MLFAGGFVALPTKLAAKSKPRKTTTTTTAPTTTAATTATTAPTATASTNTTTTTPSAGYSLSFDGNSFVRVPDSSSLQIDGSNAFSVTFWAYLRQYDNNVLPRFWEKGADYLCVMGDRSNARYRNIALEVANASGGGNDNGGVTEFWGSTRLNTNTWYFIAVTFDGSLAAQQAQIYVNGVPEAMTTIYPWSGTLLSTRGFDWFIGRRHTDLQRNLNGNIDSMVVRPRAQAANHKVFRETPADKSSA